MSLTDPTRTELVGIIAGAVLIAVNAGLLILAGSLR